MALSSSAALDAIGTAYGWEAPEEPPSALRKRRARHTGRRSKRTLWLRRRRVLVPFVATLHRPSHPLVDLVPRRSGLAVVGHYCRILR